MAKYKPYEKYKDSGIEWIGQVPEHWVVTRLKEVLKLVTQKAKVDDITKPYIGLEHIESWTGKFALSDGEEMEESTANTFCPGMILFGKLRPYLAKCILVNFFGRCSSELLSFYAKRDYSCEGYIKYFFLTDGVIKEIDAATYGVKMPRASWSYIRSLPLALPSINEQLFISSYIDQKTNEIDDLIADKDRLIQLLQEYRQAAISEAVTKGLNPDVKMKDSGVEWIGDIPEHWEVVPFFTTLQQHKNINRDNVEENVLSLSYGRIKIRDVSNNTGLLPESFATYNIVEPGNIVLRLTDLQNDWTSLRCGLVRERGIITSAYLTLNVDDSLLPAYVYYLLHTYDLLKVFYGMGGGVRQSLKYSDLKWMPIVIPPKSEQLDIVACVDSQTESVHDLILNLQESVTKLKEFRQSLISEAVTGKIDVREVV